MDFIVLDTHSNNVIGQFDTFEEAEAYRIQTVGFNPELAEYVKVVDVDQLLAACPDLEKAEYMVGGGCSAGGECLAAGDS